MKLSDAGLAFIVSFEGLHTKLPDGRFAAYRCPAGVWTIYAGCTEGVKQGDVCTEDEGREMFRRELAKHEAAVRRLVTVDLTQQQFDALVSFSYNCGAAALGKSSLLKHLNKGDYARAASHFADWKRAGGKVLNGLVRRRAAEAALFLSGEPALMAQKIDAEATKMKPVEAVFKVGAPVVAVFEGVRQVAETVTPPAKPNVKATIEKVKQARETIEQAKDLGVWGKGFATWASGEGLIVCVGIALVAGAVLVLPKLRGQS